MRNRQLFPGQPWVTGGEDRPQSQDLIDGRPQGSLGALSLRMRPSTGYPRRRPSAGRSAAAGPLRLALHKPYPILGDDRNGELLEPLHFRGLVAQPLEEGPEQVVVVAERTARDEVSPAVEPEVIVDRLEGRLASRRLASATRIAPIPGHLPAPEPASRHSTRPVPGRFPRGSAASSGVRNPHPEVGAAPERRWSLRRDSNPGPLPYQGSALPPELRRPVRDPILLVRWPRHRGPAPAAGGGEEHRGWRRRSSTGARAGRRHLAAGRDGAVPIRRPPSSVGPKGRLPPAGVPGPGSPVSAPSSVGCPVRAGRSG